MLEKYQPSNEASVIRFKLMFACANRINRMDPLCLNLKVLIARGDQYYASARTIYGDFMETIYHYGLGYKREPALFTEPLSEEYCKQSFALYEMINTTHPDLSLDLRSILKYRISADSQICLEYKYPVEMPTYEHVLAERVRALSYYAVPENSSHPIYAVYNTTAELLKLNKTANVTGDFMSAGNEIYNIIINNRTQQHYLQYPIRDALTAIPRVYVLMGTEPVRLGYAQELYNLNKTLLNPLVALTVTARASEAEVNTLVDGIPGNLNYVTMSLETFNTFESLHDQALHYIEKLVSDGLSVNAALNYVSYACAAFFHHQENFSSVFASGDIQMYLNTLLKLHYCQPFNATRIVEYSRNMTFSTALQIPMRYCTELAETESHNYLHPHNLLSEAMHKRAHELQEPTMLIMNVMSLVMFLSLLAYVARKQLKSMKKYMTSTPAPAEPSPTLLERAPLLSPTAKRTSPAHSIGKSFFQLRDNEKMLRLINATKPVKMSRSENRWMAGQLPHFAGRNNANFTSSALLNEETTTPFEIATHSERNLKITDAQHNQTIEIKRTLRRP